MNHRIAFYRKYRPSSFSEIVGQKFIVQTLSNSIIKNKQSHAYIFSGPKGVGKTSIAKIFSKVLNCLDPKNGDCCNNCNNCNLINQNQATDIIELDAASNNGVAEVRSIIDTINYLPSILKYKVYIIDEAHMLSNAAWNAFLKLIEDPPKYLVFIFATTESYKFPPTIISRCQRYNFLKLNNDELKKYLLTICKKEKIKIDDLALIKIAELADGSLRDACSLLDQLDSYTNSNINIQDIYDVFGLLDISEKINLFKFIWSSDIEKIINKIEEYETNGVDFYQLALDLINILYDKLVFERTKNLSLLKYLPSNQTNFLELQPKFIIRYLDVWQENLNKIRNSSNQKFFFKMTCFELCELLEFNGDTNLTNSTLIIKEDKTKEKIKNQIEAVLTNSKKAPISDKKLVQENNEETIKEIYNHQSNLIDSSITKKPVKTTNTNSQVILDEIDTSSFKKVKLSDNMKIVDINGKHEDKKINIVDSYVNDFIKVEHLNKDANVFSKFNIENKKVKSLDNESEVISTSKQQTKTFEQVLIPKKNKKENKSKSKQKKEETIENTLFSFDDFQEENHENDLLMEQFNEIEEVKFSEAENKPKVKSKKESKKESPIQVNKKEFEQPKVDNQINKIDTNDAFLRIAINTNNNERQKVLNFFNNIKNSTPANKFESIIKEMDKVIVVSNNGIAFLSEDDFEINNLNKNNQNVEFLEYIKDKLNKLFLVIAISKQQAVTIGNKIREEKLSPLDVQDVNIEFLKKKMKSKPSAKDIAENILSDLIIEEEE